LSCTRYTVNFMMRIVHLNLLLCLALVSSGCQPSDSPERTADNNTEMLTIFAASSLVDVFNELGTRFEAENPGALLVFNFASSAQLAQQLAQGAPADIFASADERHMNNAIETGRVEPGSARALVSNRLVVVFPSGNPGGIQTLQDLSRPGLKLVLATPETPVGQYTLEFLDKASQDPAFGEVYKEDVLKNVVSYEENVRAVLSKVALGEADAGVVYLTDLSSVKSGSTGSLPIPDPLNVMAVYWIAATNDSAQPLLAQDFLDFVLSPDNQDIFLNHGFQQAPPNE